MRKLVKFLIASALAILPVVAEAATVVGPISTVFYKDEGVTVSTTPNTIDFVGSGVTVTKTGVSSVTVTIAGGGGGGGGGYFVEPATVTFNLDQGFTASAGTVNGVSNLYGPILVDTPTVSPGFGAGRSSLSFDPTIGQSILYLRSYDTSASNGGIAFENYNEDVVAYIKKSPQLSGVFSIQTASNVAVGLKDRFVIDPAGKIYFRNPSGTTFIEYDPIGTSSFTIPVYLSTITINSQLKDGSGSAGVAGYVLTSNGSSSAPTWQASSGGGGGSSLPFPSGATNYVWVTTGAIQPGAFNISSGSINGSLQITGDVNDTFVSGRRNRFLNGDMVIDQQHEGASFTVSGAGNTYGPDMFFGYTRNHSGQWSVQQLSASPPPGFTYYARATITTADTGAAHDDEYVMSARIEGCDVSDFAFGTSAPKTITASFWVRTSTAGRYSFAFGNQNSHPQHYYVSTYTITAPDVWQYVTITVPGDTQSNWHNTVGTIGLKLIWDFGDGVDLSTTTPGWTADLAAEHMTGSMRLITVSGATFDLTGVQVEAGSHATKFEFHPRDEELRRCQRFYEKSYKEGDVPGTNTGNGTGSNVSILHGSELANNETDFYIPFKVRHYAVPTMTFYAADGTAGSWLCFDTTGASFNTSITGTEIEGVDGTGFYQNTEVYYFCLGHYVASSRLE